MEYGQRLFPDEISEGWQVETVGNIQVIMQAF